MSNTSHSKWLVFEAPNSQSNARFRIKPLNNPAYSQAIVNLTLLSRNPPNVDLFTEEGLDLVEEFYTEESSKAEQQPIGSRSKTISKLNQDDGFVQDMQKGLQGSVRAVN